MIDYKLVHEYTKSMRILYVEDNATLRESTLLVLENFFKTVDTAVDGLDGIDHYKTYLNQYGSSYDLVITDINMPHIDGLEMSEGIRELEPEQAIICISAHNETTYLLKAIQIGISSFLLKPLIMQNLAQELYKICQAISDRKLVREYYQQLEEMNERLEKQKEELQLKTLEQEKLLRLLDTIGIKSDNREKSAVQKSMQPEQTHTLREKEDVYYAQIEELICEDLTELQELHTEIDANIIAIIGGDDSLIEKISSLFTRYASILGAYSSFDALSAAMMDFTHAMTIEPLPKNSAQTKEIFTFLEAFMYILGKWQKELLAQSDKKLNQLDVSIIGDIETITNMWLAGEESSQECEVEFF